ncbi:hypothetical protein OHS59_19935 [Streptomyces sp. NBC_00414]|uniref:hypothetical protein n=1 Tax=Streptomyces sp. NBC_00414 TaxID=2975739 RepID=UPI002E1FB601
MAPVGTGGDTRLVTSLELSNQGRPRPDVSVRVRIGLGHSGDPRPDLERRLDGGWKKVGLTPDDKGSTGVFRMNLPRGSSLAFLRLTPRVSPEAEGDGLPVDVTMTDGSRTGWKDATAPDDGSPLSETLTMPFGKLPADATREFRFRFAAGEDLDRDVRRLTVTARANGKATGASERSLGTAAPLTFGIR